MPKVTKEAEEFTEAELGYLNKVKQPAIKDFKRYGILDHTMETFKVWQPKSLEVDHTNSGSYYVFVVTCDEKDFSVKVTVPLPSTNMGMPMYKGIEGEGCCDPEAAPQEEGEAEE